MGDGTFVYASSERQSLAEMKSALSGMERALLRIANSLERFNVMDFYDHVPGHGAPSWEDWIRVVWKGKNELETYENERSSTQSEELRTDSEAPVHDRQLSFSFGEQSLAASLNQPIQVDLNTEHNRALETPEKEVNG